MSLASVGPGASACRVATLADVPDVAQIHWDSWIATYSSVFPAKVFEEFSLDARRRNWQRSVERMGASATPCEQLWVVGRAGEGVLGFASVGPWRPTKDIPAAQPGVGELMALYLRPDSQRQRLGTALLGAGAAWLSDSGFAQMRLWVIADNAAAIAFYESCGGTRLAIQTFDLHGTHITEHCYQWRLPLGG